MQLNNRKPVSHTLNVLDDTPVVTVVCADGSVWLAVMETDAPEAWQEGPPIPGSERALELANQAKTTL